MQYHPLFTDEYLMSHWGNEIETYLEKQDSAVLSMLRQWNGRDTKQTEGQLEGPFVDTFFKNLWGYTPTGNQVDELEYSLTPQYLVKGAGQGGGTGKADLALGFFKRTNVPDIPQVLCEFKDIKSSLDAPQNRKGNTRSPVKQCLDYLKHAYDATSHNSSLVPTWGIATDMNEFRLYYRKKGQDLFLRFVIEARAADEISLSDDTEQGQRQRFLFWKTFRQEMLLATHGRSSLEKLFDGQIVQEKALEKGFYLEYKAYRQYVYETIVDANPNFGGTKKELVRLTQRLMDRFIFLLFCEDMGRTLDFPVDLVRDVLAEESRSKFYSSAGNNIWAQIKSLFNAMRDGGLFPPSHKINRFNGGLFQTNSELESLIIPNRIFCSEGQGENAKAIDEIKNTLLYFSATYNFGASGSGKSTISLYALGRIFEQSITELEYMEAEAEAAELAESKGEDVEKAVKNAKSIAKLNKRKRDGVFYTPEWVTAYIVRETVGVRLEDERKALGLEIGRAFTKRQISVYRKTAGTSEGEKNPVRIHLNALGKYQAFLSGIKILDPACGSGAFLIQTLEFLLSQHKITISENKRLAGGKSLFDQDAIIREILSNNLYGVDLSPESVEIAQLALWLNTARKGKPLSNLDHHIREGNSLVGPDYFTFYKNQHDSLFNDLNADEQEKVNPFDWNSSFPEVFGDEVDAEDRGFDCIVGNPPYVKLQNFRKIKPDESEYLLHHKDRVGVPVFASTQTGNVDLYLPFIEKGISLLNSRGRMGYIAPNVWLKNSYGKGLRAMLKKSGQIDRWIDFKSFQVFSEATVYTAIQFFSKQAQRHLKFSLSPEGEVIDVDWKLPYGKAPISKLSNSEPWTLLYKNEWQLLRRLKKECKTLGEMTEEIFVGIQTSADWCYHVDLTINGKFIQTKMHPDKSPPDGIEYDFETEILKPLVSGAEAKRYLLPDTITYLIFPYDLSGDSPRLWRADEMSSRFPQTWAYLKRYETQLRARESSSFDDETWYRFGRNQNIDKQHLSKLGVAETVPALRLFADTKGKFCFNNVRVNGIFPKKYTELFFLLGVMNSSVANWSFTKIAKPKDNGFYESNKQFISPLPVPKGTEPEKNSVARLAELLQTLHTLHRDESIKLQKRIDSPNCREKSLAEDWLWAHVQNPLELKHLAPTHLEKARDRTKWAKQEWLRRLDDEFEKIDSLLRVGMRLWAECEDDAILVKGGESNSSVTLICKYGLNSREAEITAALWNQILRSLTVSEKFSGKVLTKKLLKFRSPCDDGLETTIVDLDKKISSIEREIDAKEIEMNSLIFNLYNLTSAEKAIVKCV